jgi:hypothetical protein
LIDTLPTIGVLHHLSGCRAMMGEDKVLLVIRVAVQEQVDKYEYHSVQRIDDALIQDAVRLILRTMFHEGEHE